MLSFRALLRRHPLLLIACFSWKEISFFSFLRSLRSVLLCWRTEPQWQLTHSPRRILYQERSNECRIFINKPVGTSRIYRIFGDTDNSQILIPPFNEQEHGHFTRDLRESGRHYGVSRIHTSLSLLRILDLDSFCLSTKYLWPRGAVQPANAKQPTYPMGHRSLSQPYFRYYRSSRSYDVKFHFELSKVLLLPLFFNWRSKRYSSWSIQALGWAPKNKT